MVDDEMLLKWFAADPRRGAAAGDHAHAGGDPGRTSRPTIRKFTFTDAFPVHWAGPALAGDGGPGDWGESLEIAHSGLKLDA